MIVNYKKTDKGSLVETNILGQNPHRIGETIKVLFKRETCGKYTVELHSTNGEFKEHSWDKNHPTPWNEEQLIAMEMYNVGVTSYNVGVYQSVRRKYADFKEANDVKQHLIGLGKQLCKKSFKKTW